MKTLKLIVAIAALGASVFISCCKQDPVTTDTDKTTDKLIETPKVGDVFPDFSWITYDDRVVEYQIISRAELLRSGKAFCVIAVDNPECEECKLFNNTVYASINVDGRAEETFKDFVFIYVTKNELTSEFNDAFLSYPPYRIFAKAPEQDYLKLTNNEHPVMYICNKDALVRYRITTEGGAFKINNSSNPLPTEVNTVNDLRDIFLTVIYGDLKSSL